MEFRDLPDRGHGRAQKGGHFAPLCSNFYKNQSLLHYVTDEEHLACISHGLDGNAKLQGLNLHMLGVKWIGATHAGSNLK